MIIKKKILSNEIIKKNKNIIDIKDIQLFYKDLVNKTGESYSYSLSNISILGNGKIFTLNYDIISDYLSFSSLSKFFAELYGKKNGCSKGNGGSMHLIDLKKKFLGAKAIVGNSIPVGAGYAYSLKLNKKKK